MTCAPRIRSLPSSNAILSLSARSMVLSASGQRVSRGPSNSISNSLFRAFLESRLEVLSHGFLQAPNSHCKRIDAVIGQLSKRRIVPRKTKLCGLLNNFYRTWNNANGDALGRSKERGNPMARSARKPEREADESAKQALTKPGKTIATPAAGEVGKTAAKAASAASLKPDIEFAGFQSGQFESLRAVLEKRSDASASARTIAEEFAALWLPVHAVDLELLVPALREAGAPESQSHAARVRKDLLNIILADLISNDHSQDTSGARLEALSDAFGAYQKAAEQEREGLGEKEGDLGRRMKDRFDRLKGRFSDLDDVLGEAMDLLAPRSLSVSASRRRSRRENDMPRYSSDTPERDDQGRFTSDNDRGSSRGRGGGDRDEAGRFASEGRSSSSRYDDDDNRSRGRDESGRFSSEGRSSRSRDDDDDNRSRGRDES